MRGRKPKPVELRGLHGQAADKARLFYWTLQLTPSAQACAGPGEVR